MNMTEAARSLLLKDKELTLADFTQIQNIESATIKGCRCSDWPMAFERIASSTRALAIVDCLPKMSLKSFAELSVFNRLTLRTTLLT